MEMQTKLNVRQQLHQLIDDVPDSQLGRLRDHLTAFDSTDDPFYAKLMASPEDDEPYTQEERAAVGEALEAVKRGDVVPWEQVRDTLG